jgi:prepilin-type N-terminal cleavage/methylation domain-containing protein
MTAGQVRRPRRGFSLPELIIAMLIFALIGGAIVKTLSGGQRAYDAQVQHIDLQQNMRLASSILTSDLRALDAYDGDIQAMDSVSIRIRSMRQMSTVCRLPVLGGALPASQVLSNVTFLVRDTTLQQGIRYFAQSDSLLIYYEGDSTRRTDDGWLAAASATDPAAGAAVACTAPVTGQGHLFTTNIRFETTPAAPPSGLPPQSAQLNAAGNVPLGAPIFGFQSVTYKRLKVGNEWYVGVDSAGVASTNQPIIGPLADSLGFKLTYYNSANAKLTWPYNTSAQRMTVARISIALALKTARPIRKNTGTPAADTSRVTLEVALRNNRRF